MMNDECGMMNGKGRSGGMLPILERTKRFALRIIRLYSALPRSIESQVIGKQVLRSGTSVGAHLRESKRSRSDAEMISLKEADELTAILVASVKTIKTRRN